MAGLVIIGIGIFLLLGQVVPDVGRAIPLVIGLIFLGAFAWRREYGLLVAGSIISGVGVGVILASTVDDPWAGAAMLMSIAGGFILIWVVSTMFNARDRAWPNPEAAKALWWPLIPGVILAIISIIVLLDEGFDSELLRWWPVLLIGAGLLVLVRASRRRSGNQGS